MKRFLLSILLATPIFMFAQSNFQKGYMITVNKDTVNGFINYQEHQKTPISFSFKASPSDQAKTFDLNTSLGYGISGNEIFQKYTVNLSTSQIENSKLSTGIDTSFRREAAFLKILQRGKNVTLFSYADELKTRFYVLEKQSAEPNELIVQRYFGSENVSEIRTQTKYINQLLLLMRKYDVSGKNEQQLDRLDYDEESIGKIVALINNEKFVRSRKTTRFFAGGGLNFITSSYSGNNEFNNGFQKSKGSFFPAITTGVDLFVNPSIGKMLFRLELGLAYSENEISSITPLAYMAEVSHRFNQFNVSLSPQIIYNFYNTQKIKLFGQAGFAVNYAQYNNNIITWYNSTTQITSNFEDAIKLEPIYFSFPLGIGAVINQKFEFSLGYSNSMKITNYKTDNVHLYRYKIGFNYLFGK